MSSMQALRDALTELRRDVNDLRERVEKLTTADVNRTVAAREAKITEPPQSAPVAQKAGSGSSSGAGGSSKK